MKVKTTELRKMADRLLTYLESTGRKEFDIPEDYYWFVSRGELFDPYEEPSELTLGQLSDDWKELNAILDDEELTIGYGLVWLSSILRVVGEKAVH